jgi:hypothetical protein
LVAATPGPLCAGNRRFRSGEYRIDGGIVDAGEILGVVGLRGHFCNNTR